MTTGFLSMMFAFNVAAICDLLALTFVGDYLLKFDWFRMNSTFWFFGLPWLLIFFATFLSSSFKSYILNTRISTAKMDKTKLLFWIYYIVSALLFVFSSVNFSKLLSSS